MLAGSRLRDGGWPGGRVRDLAGVEGDWAIRTSRPSASQQAFSLELPLTSSSHRARSAIMREYRSSNAASRGVSGRPRTLLTSEIVDIPLPSLIPRPRITERASKTQQVQTRHPVIDQDPHFKRVVAYMRPSDYITWAGLTGAFPGAFWIMREFRLGSAGPTTSSSSSSSSTLSSRN